MRKHFNVAMGAMIILTANVAGAMEILPKVTHPADNPTSAAKVKLGRQLYFDSRLSSTGTVSCNSCHNVLDEGGHDGLATSTGINGLKGGRNAPTVWNSALLSVQFWDGRAPSLEEQAKGPLINPVEMGMHNHAAVVDVVKKIPGYVAQFQAIYGGQDPVSIDTIAKSIAAYERTLVTPNSPVDRYLGGNKKALSPAAVRGMALVQSVGCVSCHMGPNYAGPALPVGTGFYQKFPVYPSKYDDQYKLTQDQGRFEVTKNESDRHVFRVPTWRNIARTAPYFHTGSVATLDEAVRVMAKSQLNKELKDGEVKDIVAFLTALNGELPREKAPQLPK